ncbi:arginyl-tRNA synthetase [Pancytospora philotis]|nr:arginyl-tRNA synthetase [Pancytospora philotis]
MHFSDVISQVEAEIVAKTGLAPEVVAKLLMKARDANRKDFCMFLNSISSEPEREAAELAEKLREISIICDVSASGAQVSFNLNKGRFFEDTVSSILAAGDDFGSSRVGAGRRAVVDFSSPNIAKIFHVGHFRTTVLGNFVVRLLRANGFDTVAMNYLGDWGKQFGLVLLGFEKYGNEERLKVDPLIHLFEIYVKISADAKVDKDVDAKAREIFRLMEEEKDERYLSQWRRFRELSIKKYEELYSKLNIKFDVYSGESKYSDKARDFVKETEQCKQDPDGSYVIDCKSAGKVLIQKSDGTTLYMTRDILAAEDRMKNYEADLLYYVVGDEQNKHFEQLFACLGQLGYDKSRFRHINYGMIKGMSTRNGQVHFLEDIIATSADVIKQKLLDDAKDIEDKDRTALILAVSTLIIADFGAKRIKGYTFNIEQRANCEAGSGAYLQYAHCRLLSIENRNTEVSTAAPDLALINTPEVAAFAYKLLWYEHIVQLCVEDFEPSRIVIYLMDLVKSTNNLVTKLRVKDVDPALASARLALFKAARVVIRNGLTVLGIEPLDKM